VFNALVQQYYIPGAQVGAKIRADGARPDLRLQANIFG
jgi:hypothetical protein